MILLTGASGFLGRHLLARLKAEYGGDGVVALTSRPLPGVRCVLHQGHTYDPNTFSDAGLDGITAVVHAGAFTPKSRLEANRTGPATRNVETTLRLLEAKLPALEQFVYLSAVDVYRPGVGIDESTQPSPQSLYGWSKLYSEKLVEAWAIDTERIAKVLRIGHVYGPGEEAYDKVIPATFRRIRASEPVLRFGTGLEERSLIYVDDVVEVVVRSLAVGLNGPLNVVGQTPVNMRTLIDMICRVAGHSGAVVDVSPEFTGHHFTFDARKVSEILPQQTPLAEGLLAEWRALAEFHD